MSINFTARLVDSPKIQQRKFFFKYDAQNASIIELDCHDTDDFNAIYKTTNNWHKKHAKYADLLCLSALDEKFSNNCDRHFYALTTQTDNFSNLKSKNILGLMLFSKADSSRSEIELLEVKPTTSFSFNLFRKYKNVGRRMVENVQKMFSDSEISLYSDSTAMEFYKKLGFQGVKGNVMNWKAVK